MYEVQCYEDNSEAELMSNEEVESVLTVIPKEAKETYNHLSMTVKKAVQRETQDATRAVRYSIVVALVICYKTTHLQIIEPAQNGSLAEVLTKDNVWAILIFSVTRRSRSDSVSESVSQ